MKVLMLFPPQWTPVSPHFALASLSSQLKNAGYDTCVLDLNIDFYNEILNKKNILDAAKKAILQQDDVLKRISVYHKPEADFSDYPFNIQNLLVKYSQVKDFILKNSDKIISIADFAENAISAIKDKQVFYKPEILVKSMSIIDEALNILSLPYYPSKFSLDSYSNPLFKFDYETIKYYVFDRDTNMFIDYFKSKLHYIKEIGAKYVGISINSSSQIIPGLTLANMLKNELDAHINIGGNFFGRVVDALVGKQEFFELFCDTMLVEEGELPVVELAEYIDGKLQIDEVSNLIYIKNGSVYVNNKKTPLKLNEMASISLDGYDFDKYFTPEIILPYQTSRGCYWGKCSFCDQGFGQNYNVKEPQKVVYDFKEIKQKYGIDKFEFIDESVAPVYLKELSEILEKEKVKVNYFIDARLETAFNSEIFSLAAKNGLKMILWGLESGSRKIMKLINKGIDIDRRLEILKNSADAGIWNFAFIFFGFPAETKEDAYMTIELLVKNKKIIHSYGRSVFTMGKHTLLREKPLEYGITKVFPAAEEFMPSYVFESSGMSKQELSDILKLCTNTCMMAYKNPLWMYLRYREYLFLYLTKFSPDYISNYQLKL